MTEKDKLANALRSYYDSQNYAAPENAWSDIAGKYAGEKKRKKRVLWLFSVIGLLGLLIILFGSLYNSANSLPLASKVLPSLPESDKTIAITRTLTQHFNNVSAITQASTLSTLKPASETPKREFWKKSAAIKTQQVKEEQHLENTDQVVIANNDKSNENTVKEIIAEQSIPNVGTGSVSPPELDESLSENSNPEIPQPSSLQIVSMSASSGTDLATEQKAISLQMPLIKGDSIVKEKIVAQEFSKKDILVVSTDQKVADTTSKMESIIDTSKFNKRSPLFSDEGLALEAGAAYLVGWKSAGTRDANGFSGYGGVNYTSNLYKKFSLSIGLHYFQINNLSTSTKTSKVSSYGFGEKITITQITPSTLHYAVLPLRLVYEINTKHQVGAALNLSYLLNVDAKKSQFEQSALATSATTTSKESGYMQGFLWYDAQAALFYRRRIGKALAIHTELFFGLKDIKNDVFFNLNGLERNSGLKLGLVYYLNANKK